jgi:hypothetical protein
MKNFLMYVDRVYAVPGWLTMRLLVLGFKEHPFKTKKLTLQQWTTYRTNEMRIFDSMFWLGIASLIFTIKLLLD